MSAVHDASLMTRDRGATRPPEMPSISRSQVLLASGLALASGGGLWLLWRRAGFPAAGTFTPGLDGHGPDPLAWPRLLVLWVPAAQLLFPLAYAWLDRTPPRRPLRRWLIGDQCLSIASLLALLGVVLVLRGDGAWRGWLGGWYVLFIGGKTALLVHALWRWLTEADAGAARASAAVFIGAFLPYLFLGAQVTTAISATSDEPYYLLVAHSLLQDGDVELGDNFARQDYLPFYWGRLTPRTGGVRVTEDGRIYARSFQGLQPLVLLPGYWLAGRAGAVVTVNLAAALALAFAFRLSVELGASRRAAFLAWLGAAFSVPVLSFAASPWPEMSGALAVTGAALLLGRERRSARTLSVAALCLTGAIALKTRLALVAMPVLLGCVRRVTWRALGLLGVALATAVVLVVAYDAAALAGSLARRAGSGTTWAIARVVLEWTLLAPTRYRGHLGLLLDQEFGLLTSAPVFALALAGVVTAAREGRWRVVALTAAPFALAWYYLGAFVTSKGPHWYGGFSPPGRFVAAALPLLSVCAAVMLDRVRGRLAWTAVAMLYVATLGYGLVISIRPAWRFQHAIGRASALVEVFTRTGVDLGRLLPSYIAPGDTWSSVGLLAMAAVLLVGWLAGGRDGGAPPRGAWLGGLAGLGAFASIVLIFLWLASGGRYPALIGHGQGGLPFRGVVLVETAGEPARHERLVWATQGPAVLEMAPRLRPGAYRVAVIAGAQGGPDGPTIRIALGDRVLAPVRMDSAPAPAWRERAYETDVEWTGGRLPIRVALTEVARSGLGRHAYVRAIDILPVERAAPAPLAR